MAHLYNAQPRERNPQVIKGELNNILDRIKGSLAAVEVAMNENRYDDARDWMDDMIGLTQRLRRYTQELAKEPASEP